MISKKSSPLIFFLVAIGAFASFSNAQSKSQTELESTQLIGSVVDAETELPIAARIYLKTPNGEWKYVQTASPEGSAWPYSEEWVPMPGSVDRHTTISAHPFKVALTPGEYEIQIERGKEYFTLRDRIVVPSKSDSIEDGSNGESLKKKFALHRFSDLSKQGWFSGETHVHRRIAELPNVMEAEELNVAFPVTFWTTSSERIPDLEPSNLRSQGPSPFGPRIDMGFEPIWCNDHTVILPRNTEYEIFSIGSRRHTLGALFILDHRTKFIETAPPIGPIVERARTEDALLDLDKHNWPWSLMLVPIASVDLFELSNNSVWRTAFGFKQPGQDLPPWKTFEQESPGLLTEWGWLQFGFEMYYALLNCGFQVSPSAGTASGVHPVPLGYSRVYVHTGDEFRLGAWRDGLKHGRSFVTTGPLLLAQMNQQWPGARFEFSSQQNPTLDWQIDLVSPDPISQIEVIVNGNVVYALEPVPHQNQRGAYEFKHTGSVRIHDSGWAIIRAWSNQSDGRKRFAHTAPWYFKIDNKPVRPPKVQIDYLLKQIDESLAQQKGILSPASLEEFEKARDIYADIQSRARMDSFSQTRPSASTDDEMFWLENMAVWHRYSVDEMGQVLGKSPREINRLLATHGYNETDRKALRPADRLAIMPYPGGRHPRRGFLDGAIEPQRDTKFSFFTPWEESSYIVADVPEAIFSNLGLIYLAHTHIPTIWDQQGIRLPVQEWERLLDGKLISRRRLPNGIEYRVSVVPKRDHVRMELSLGNGTTEPLTGLRVQNCMMLTQAKEFESSTNNNKIFHQDYALVHDVNKSRWLITSWKPLGRAWGNPPVPCIHADPILPDCPPGETTRAQGWLSFYEGDNWLEEIKRIEETRWWETPVE